MTSPPSPAPPPPGDGAAALDATASQAYRDALAAGDAVAAVLAVFPGSRIIATRRRPPGGS